MVLHRKRSLLLGMGLSVALVLAVALPATASAVSTLAGETLNGSSSQGNSPPCDIPTYRVDGTATGPYLGTFTETGSWSFIDFTLSATFTITSGTTTITGSKSGELGGGSSCGELGANANVGSAFYTATIHTPNGNFHDEGISAVSAAITPSGAATLRESFFSLLAEPVLIGPNSKDQCKNNGWKAFPQQFKNQGECVSFVQSHSQT